MARERCGELRAVSGCDSGRQRDLFETVHAVDNTAERWERMRVRTPQPQRRKMREGLWVREGTEAGRATSIARLSVSASYAEQVLLESSLRKTRAGQGEEPWA